MVTLYTGTISSLYILAMPYTGTISSLYVLVMLYTGTIFSLYILVTSYAGTISSLYILVKPYTGTISSLYILVMPYTGTIFSFHILVTSYTGIRTQNSEPRTQKFVYLTLKLQKTNKIINQIIILYQFGIWETCIKTKRIVTSTDAIFSSHILVTSYSGDVLYWWRHVPVRPYTADAIYSYHLQFTFNKSHILSTKI